MLEMKITITAADLAAAINGLAVALEKSTPRTVCNQHGNDNKHIDNAGTVNIGATLARQVPVAPVNPTAPVPGAPLIATPAQSPALQTPATPPQGAQAIQTPAAPAITVPTANAVPVVPTVPAQQAPVAPAQPAALAVPTAAPQYTLEMIATAGSALIDAGKLDQLMALLGKYGVDSLTNLAPENYGAIAQELRALGARI